MKKLRIVYLGNFGNEFSDETEKHIKFALEQLGHEVIPVDEKNFTVDEIIKAKADIFLFHKAAQSYGFHLPLLLDLLNRVTAKKVCWYFDKIWKDRESWMEAVTPFCDHVFVTDESWARRHTFKHVHVLHQGIGNEDMTPGKFVEGMGADVVFVGSVYGERQKFLTGLQQTYGDKFKHVNGAFGRRLYDLCASSKVFVAPKYPQDDFYWSSRVYMILGSGGFLLHPRLHAMKEEFEDKKNIVFYFDGQDLKEKIDYYLTHDEEREAIRKAGYELVTSKYTYQHRIEALLKTIYG